MRTLDDVPGKVEFKTVSVTTLYDVRRVIADFTTNRPTSPPVKTFLASTDSQGHRVQYAVEAPSDCDYQSLLKQGMEMIRKRLEIANRVGEKAAKLFSLDSPTWVDQLIERRMGGKREGLRVKWELAEGIFYWDPETNKLTKCES